jgi:hypothetical protein
LSVPDPTHLPAPTHPSHHRTDTSFDIFPNSVFVFAKVSILAPSYPAGSSAAERVAKFVAAEAFFSGPKEGLVQGLLTYKSGKQLFQNAKGKFTVLQEAATAQSELAKHALGLVANHKTADMAAMKGLITKLGPRIAATAFTEEQATAVLKQIMLQFDGFFTASDWFAHDWKGPQATELLDVMAQMTAADALHNLHEGSSSFATVYSQAHGLLRSLMDAYNLNGHAVYSWKPF